MKRKLKPLIFLLTCLLGVLPATADNFTLEAISTNLHSKYQTLNHLPGKDLAAIPAPKKQENYLIFDVREPEEYAVSHIAGAEQVNPDSWRQTVLKKYANQVKDKTVIFYCSVGVRSSKMASALQQDLMKAGAKAVYNLDKGLFGWANNQHPMVNAQGPTLYVHPYNAHWGQLLKSKDLWAYK